MMTAQYQLLSIVSLTKVTGQLRRIKSDKLYVFEKI